MTRPEFEIHISGDRFHVGDLIRYGGKDVLEVTVVSPTRVWAKRASRWKLLKALVTARWRIR